MWREAAIAEDLRAATESLRDDMGTVALPWLQQALHPRAEEKLRYLMRNRRAFFDISGPLVSYSFADFFCFPHLSLLEYLDLFLQSYVAGAAFSTWPADSAAQFNRKWSLVPVAGDVAQQVG